LGFFEKNEEKFSPAWSRPVIPHEDWVFRPSKTTDIKTTMNSITISKAIKCLPKLKLGRVLIACLCSSIGLTMTSCQTSHDMSALSAALQGGASGAMRGFNGNSFTTGSLSGAMNGATRAVQRNRQQQERAERQRQHQAYLASLTPAQRAERNRQNEQSTRAALGLAALLMSGGGGGGSSSSSSWTSQDEAGLRAAYAPAGVGVY